MNDYRTVARNLTTALAALSLLTGCATALPPLPVASLKDTPARPEVKQSFVRHDITIAPPIVIGGSEADNRRLALALENELRAIGYDVRSGGPYRILGAINTAVTWTIIKPDGSQAIVKQSNPSTPALRAVVPGVQSHLPRPSTPL